MCRERVSSLSSTSTGTSAGRWPASFASFDSVCSRSAGVIETCLPLSARRITSSFDRLCQSLARPRPQARGLRRVFAARLEAGPAAVAVVRLEQLGELADVEPLLGEAEAVDRFALVQP